MIRLLSILTLALTLTQAHAQDAPALAVVNVNTGLEYATISEAVDAASAGDVLQMMPVRFIEHVQIDKPLTLKGDPDRATILDVSQEDGWGVTLSSDHITLEGFTITSGDLNSSYAVHSEPGITGLTMQNIEVENSTKSCIDLNGLTGPDFNTLENLTVSGSSIGFGLAMSSCSNMLISNITSEDNGFGDIAIMESNHYSQEFHDIVFTGELNLGGPQSLGGGGIVVQVDPSTASVGKGAAFAINVSADGFIHMITSSGESLTGCIVVHEDHVRQVASVLGAQIVDLVSLDLNNQAMVVFPGMHVQSAIGAASDGAIIKVEPGTADTQPLTLDHSVTLLGSNAGISGGDPALRDVECTLPPIVVTGGHPTLDGLHIEAGDMPAIDIRAEAEGLTLKNSVIAGTASDAASGIVARQETALEGVLVAGFDAGIIQHSGTLFLSHSVIQDNKTGLRVSHNGGTSGVTDLAECAFENAGGVAVDLSSGSESDAFSMTHCSLNLHETGVIKSSNMEVTFEANAFTNSELQLSGFSQGDQLSLCAENDFFPALPITGCTEPSASNYEPYANLNQGCLHLGCTSPKACNFDAGANTDDGTCDWVTCAACPLGFACNYVPEAELFNVDACDFTGCQGQGMAIEDEEKQGVSLIEGCTLTQACNYDPNADISDGSCTFDCFGCLDDAACNYDGNFTQAANETCLYKEDVFASPHVDCEGQCHNDANENGVCDEEEVHGCMNVFACNYLETATLDDGDCDLASCAGCTNPAACNFEPGATVTNGTCDYHSCAGCIEADACNYDGLASIDDGSCTWPVDLFGKTHVDCAANCLHDQDEDGICDEEEVAGCVDPLSCNYKPDATDADDSCEYTSCAGCTDASACNYDPWATVENDACSSPAVLYPASVVDGVSIVDCLGRCNNDSDNDGICDENEAVCLGDVNLDGLRGTSDILILLGSFGCDFNCAPADLNGDGIVAVSDVLVALNAYGVACPN